MLIPGFDEEKTSKLILSTSAAFPLTDDPWASLAHGLSLDRGELSRLLDELVERGALAGIRGEPNPARPGAHEALVQGAPPQGAVIRWAATDSGGSRLYSVYSGAKVDVGDPASAFFKCGVTGERLSGRGGGLLEAESDRTVRIPPQPPPAELLAEKWVPLATLLLRPHALDHRRSFWGYLGDLAGLSPEDAREGCRRCILSRHWRRLALAFNPGALGLNGCGLAAWRFSDAEDAPLAAGALASIAATGDVAIRGNRVTAVIVAREAGQGQSTAQTISSQWSLPLDSWVDFADFRHS